MFAPGNEWEGSCNSFVMFAKGKGSIFTFESMDLCSTGSGRNFPSLAATCMASRYK